MLHLVLNDALGKCCLYRCLHVHLTSPAQAYTQISLRQAHARAEATEAEGEGGGGRGGGRMLAHMPQAGTRSGKPENTTD